MDSFHFGLNMGKCRWKGTPAQPEIGKGKLQFGLKADTWVSKKRPAGSRDYPSPSPPPSPPQPLPLPSWKLITVHLIQYKRSKSILSFILVWKSTATIGTLYTPWFKELRYNQLKTFANFLVVSVPPEGSRTLAEAQWGHQYNESTSLSVPFFNVIR